jgi:hypothetical protein
MTAISIPKALQLDGKEQDAELTRRTELSRMLQCQNCMEITIAGIKVNPTTDLGKQPPQSDEADDSHAAKTMDDKKEETKEPRMAQDGNMEEKKKEKTTKQSWDDAHMGEFIRAMIEDEAEEHNSYGEDGKEDDDDDDDEDEEKTACFGMSHEECDLVKNDCNPPTPNLDGNMLSDTDHECSKKKEKKEKKKEEEEKVIYRRGLKHTRIITDEGEEEKEEKKTMTPVNGTTVKIMKDTIETKVQRAFLNVQILEKQLADVMLHKNAVDLETIKTQITVAKKMLREERELETKKRQNQKKREKRAQMKKAEAKKEAKREAKREAKKEAKKEEEEEEEEKEEEEEEDEDGKEKEKHRHHHHHHHHHHAKSASPPDDEIEKKKQENKKKKPPIDAPTPMQVEEMRTEIVTLRHALKTLKLKMDAATKLLRIDEDDDDDGNSPPPTKKRKC